MFKFQIERTVEIDGCPENGLAAVDFRRANGLPDGTDNRVLVLLDVTDEQLVRDCAAVGVHVDQSGDVDLRKTYSGGTLWYRRSEWSRAGHSHEGTYLVTAPAALLVRVLASEYAAFVELLTIYVADCRAAVAAWDAAESDHVEKLAREAADKAAKTETIAAAKLLLKDDLSQRDKLKQSVSELSDLLVNIPMDAINGALKKMTAGEPSISIEQLKKTIEDASDQWLFSNRDDDEDDSDN